MRWLQREMKVGGRKCELVARLKLTRAITELKVKFSKKFGVIKVIIGNPSAVEVVEGL